MRYGTKPKPKPKVEQLTFNKAKNSWLDSWRGKVAYPKAKELIDILRNDYLKGDNAAWERWKATPLRELDSELINFIHEVIEKIEDKKERFDWLFMLESFIFYVNHNLLHGSTSPLLMRAQITSIDARIKALDIYSSYEYDDEYEDDYEEE